MASDTSRPPRSVLPPLPEDAVTSPPGGALPRPERATGVESRPPPASTRTEAELANAPSATVGRRSRSTEGRRLASAGHGLVVAVLALLIGMVLNAPGSHKAAFNRTAGWQRDVALGLTGPLAGMSHALFLDRPREALQSAIGRAGEDTINVAIQLPPPTKPIVHTSTPSAKPAPVGAQRPARIAFTPKHKLRIWIAGDSLMIVPGYSITRAGGASPVIKPVGGVDGRISTGLERPDVFNWFTEIASKMKELRPNVVVLSFGGNDDHGYMTGLPAGVEIDGFGSTSWLKEYRRRVGGIMDTVTRSGAHLIWLGLPLTRSPAQTQRFDRINAAVVAEANRRPHAVTYLDTYSLFATQSGGYSDYRRTASGQVERVRASDGVHFESAGGDLIAREVLKDLNEVYDLTSWRKRS